MEGLVGEPMMYSGTDSTSEVDTSRMFLSRCLKHSTNTLPKGSNAVPFGCI